MLKLSDSVEKISGIGEKAAKRLRRLNIHSVEDLIHHYPRRYDNYSKITSLNKLKTGPVTVSGQIEKVATRRSRRGLKITEAMVRDNHA